MHKIIAQRDEEFYLRVATLFRKRKTRFPHRLRRLAADIDYPVITEESGSPLTQRPPYSPKRVTKAQPLSYPRDLYQRFYYLPKSYQENNTITDFVKNLMKKVFTIILSL